MNVKVKILRLKRRENVVMIIEDIVNLKTCVYIIIVDKYVTNSSGMENVKKKKAANTDTLEIADIGLELMKDANMEKHVDICTDGGKTHLKMLWKKYQWR